MLPVSSIRAALVPLVFPNLNKIISGQLCPCLHITIHVACPAGKGPKKKKLKIKPGVDSGSRKVFNDDGEAVEPLAQLQVPSTTRCEILFDQLALLCLTLLLKVLSGHPGIMPSSMTWCLPVECSESSRFTKGKGQNYPSLTLPFFARQCGRGGGS